MQFTLVLNDKCNLSCEYCCVLDSLNQGNSITLEDVYSFLNWQLSLYSKDEEHIIEFFGGEPTINWNSIKEIFKYLETNYSDYKLSYRIYTNCVFNSKVKNDSETWAKFDDIICSIDGDFEDNLYRTKSKNTHSLIIENYKHLLEVSNNSGVAFVVHPESNLKGVFNYFKDMGTRYYHFELATLWKDNTDNGITNEYIFNFFKFIYENILVNNLKDSSDFSLFSVPRELLSSKYFFLHEDRKSCLDVMRSLSPRGNIYFCRDLAVSEDHLGKMEQEDPAMIFRENSFKSFNIKDLQLNIESNDYSSKARSYDSLTSCPIKSFEFEHLVQAKPLWLEEDFQKLIIFPMFEIMNATFAWYSEDKTSDPGFFKEYSNKINTYGYILSKYEDIYYR